MRLSDIDKSVPPCYTTTVCVHVVWESLLPPSVKVRVTAKAKSGPCGHCEQDIPEATLHATLHQTFGKSKAGKTKYKGWHLHLVCLPKWLIGDHIRYMLRKKGTPGRTVGSLPNLTPENGQRRKWLVRTRARLIREVIRSDDKEHTRTLHTRLLGIKQELMQVGGDVNNNLVRRAPEARETFRTKTRHMK